MTIRGDFAGLNRAVQGIQRLAGAPARAAAKAAPELQELLEEEFDAGRSPEGKPWAPLATSTRQRGRTPPPLTASGEMRAGSKVSAAGGNITVTAPHPAEVHQAGTLFMPARPIEPEGGVPKTWEGALEASVDQTLRGTLKGR